MKRPEAVSAGKSMLAGKFHMFKRDKYNTRRHTIEMIRCFDAHCDTVSRCLAEGEGLYENSGHIDLRRGLAFSAYAQIFALFYNSGKTPDGRCLGEATRQRDFLMAELERNAEHAVFCRTTADVRRAHEQHKVAALLGIEGGELLDCEPGNIEIARNWGARYVTLTWNHTNALSGTNREQSDRGLTDQGRDFVRTLYANGILPDVSHLSDPGFWDTVELGLGPVIATHSNSRAVCPHPRNLTDDMFRAIVQTGGGAGLNLYSEFVGGRGGSADMLLRHVDHLLSLGGEDALCLGADMDGCETLTAGLKGLQSIPSLYETFERHGFDQPLLDKLFFDNWMRIFARTE